MPVITMRGITKKKFLQPGYFMTFRREATRSLTQYTSGSRKPQQKGHEISGLKGREVGTQECWICQTWALLKHAGLHFPLVTALPEEGLVIMHADRSTKFLKDDASFSEKLFVINIVADTRPHPRAHLNIVQNKAYHYFTPYSLFMPHWSQAHLIMRDPARGARFENIVFFGYSQIT